MTISRHIYCIITLILLAFCSVAGAQDLPEMPADPSVKSGSLPNGTHYYIMANSETKGMADFALVQKDADMAESVLKDLPVLGVSPLKFFSDNGAVPHNGRFLQRENDAALFRFAEVMLSAKPSMLDSTLLVLMGMVDASKDVCAPSRNAVVVSGDVNPESVVEKLKMLSYMIPVRAARNEDAYTWEESETTFAISPSEGSTSSISVSWKLPRTPERFIGTIQPAVHRKLMYELGIIAEDRVARAFAQKGIPFAKVSHRHVPSSETDSDEKFSIIAVVSEKHLEKAVSTMADALSSIKEKGVSVNERNRAEADFGHSLFVRTRRPIRSDALNVELCINAFLNKAKPVTDASLYGFHTSKDVNDTTETLALDMLADAFMKIDRNVEVHVKTASKMSSESLKDSFISAWNTSSEMDAVELMHPSDTLLNLSVGKKVPVLLIRKEHMSGGWLWTFANGIRVVYKRMETGGCLYWAMGLSEGYGAIKNLKEGEGAFAADMFTLSRIAGTPWEDYMAFLKTKEIHMDAAVGLSNTIIRGTAPSYELPMVMRALRAVANEREFDSEAFRQYKRNEWLRMEQTRFGSKRVIDSLMCPGYKYSKIKSPGRISEELPAKTEALFDEIFAKVNDGVIVLVGDREESSVRKQLSECLGNFSTKKAAGIQSRVSYQPISGAMTHFADGDRNAVYLAMSVAMPLTLDNYALSEVTGMVIEKRLTSALVGSGMYAKVFSDRRITPHERFNVMVVLEEVPGAFREDSLDEARRILKEEMENGLFEITDVQLNACKEWMKHNRAVRSSKPEFWLNALLLRYLEGKDFTTGYAARIDKVSADGVKDLLNSLNTAGKVEYIIRRK